jgi:hypothetical protein
LLLVFDPEKIKTSTVGAGGSVAAAGSWPFAAWPSKAHQGV